MNNNKYKELVKLFDELPNPSLRAFNRFTDTLGLTYFESYNLLVNHPNAVPFLYSYGHMVMCGIETNSIDSVVKHLMEKVLYREDNFNSPITDDEINFVKNIYDIDIKKK